MNLLSCTGVRLPDKIQRRSQPRQPRAAAPPKSRKRGQPAMQTSPTGPSPAGTRSPAPTPPESAFSGSKIPSVGGIAAVVIPAILWFAPLGLEPKIQHALAITVFMIICWISEALDASLTGVIGCYLFWALEVVPFNVAFGGFPPNPPCFLFGAILLGRMAPNRNHGVL